MAARKDKVKFESGGLYRRWSEDYRDIGPLFRCISVSSLGIVLRAETTITGYRLSVNIPRDRQDENYKRLRYGWVGPLTEVAVTEISQAQNRESARYQRAQIAKGILL